MILEYIDKNGGKKMKINKIQCDICGKMVNYNGKNMSNVLLSKSSGCISPSISRDFYEQFKVNRFSIYGIIDGKNIQESINKENNYRNVLINMEFDLCEECLIDLYKIINEWKDRKEV